MTSTASSSESQPAIGRRRPWVAVVLALIIGPFVMLHLGRPRRAAVYLLAIVVCPAIAFGLFWLGAWPPALPWQLVFDALALAWIIDAYRIAKWHSAGFTASWFTTWWGIVAVAAAGIGSVIVFRVFVLDWYTTPGESMLPTLHKDDHILVSKRAYLRAPPQRGDVIVFRLPDTGVRYIKRVVGLPGEVIIYDSANKRVVVNGTPADMESLGTYAGDAKFDVVRETLDDHSHSLVLIRDARGAGGGTYRVPAGYYFVLGDNRDNSFDSRYEGFGLIPSTSVLGKLGLVWWNGDEPNRAGTVPE